MPPLRNDVVGQKCRVSLPGSHVVGHRRQTMGSCRQCRGSRGGHGQSLPAAASRVTPSSRRQRGGSHARCAKFATLAPFSSHESSTPRSPAVAWSAENDGCFATSVGAASEPSAPIGDTRRVDTPLVAATHATTHWRLGKRAVRRLERHDLVERDRGFHRRSLPWRERRVGQPGLGKAAVDPEHHDGVARERHRGNDQRTSRRSAQGDGEWPRTGPSRGTAEGLLVGPGKATSTEDQPRSRHRSPPACDIICSHEE